MPVSEPGQEITGEEKELKIDRLVAFAAGIFQGDVTVHTLLESLAEGVMVIDSSGIILLVNSRAEQMFGYAEQELIGKPHSLLIPDRFQEIHHQHEAHYYEAPKVGPMGQLLDIEGLRRDGSEIPIDLSLGSIETMNGVFVLALVTDVTPRKQAEKALQQSEELFHIQLESVRDYAIVMLDPQGNLLNWNPGAERLRGYRAEEIIGKHFSCFYTEEDRDAGRPDDNLKRAAAEGRIEDEGWRLRRDGSRFWAGVIITALRNENRDLRGFSHVTHDITRRTQTEEALRLSEARYRALYRDNPTMIVTLDTELTMLSVNPACARILGYQIEELEGRSVLKLFQEDDHHAVAEQLRLCFQNPDQVYRGQFRKIHKDGALLWVEETAQAVAADGSLNLLFVCQDITQRKQAEEALRRSEERLRFIVENSPDAVFFQDRDLRFVEVIKAPFPFSAEEMLGRTISDLFPPDEARRLTEMKQPLLETGERFHGEVCASHAGEKHWYDVTIQPTRDERGEIAGIWSYTSNITQDKLTQETLRESEERFRLLADTAPVMIWAADADASYTFFNKAWLDFTGRSLEQELGDGWRQGVHPDDKKLCLDTYLSAVKSRQSFSIEYRLRRADGSYGWLVDTGVPRLAPAGDLLGYIGTCFDITERKQVKEELQNTNELLVQRVAERTAELSDTIKSLKGEINERIQMGQALQEQTTERLNAQAELREKELLLLQQSRLAAMGEMIGNIAHQWRQPLNVLGLLAQDLAMTYKQGEFSTQYLETNVKKVLETINHMSRTIDDFRNFFSTDKEKVDFRIADAVQKTISLLEVSLNAQQIRTEFVLLSDPVMNGYPSEFAQVLLNIIVNARDALVAKQVTHPLITIELDERGGKSVMTITDNAGGIPEEILDRIFDPYFTTKGPDKGTGVGLYMSKIIIEKNMGGSLTARNVEDGAELRIVV